MSYDPFEGIPRVPKTDKSGVQIGVGGIAPNKQYASVGVVDDYMEAVALYNKRKRGEIPEIEGGINDESPELYMKNGNFSPFKKMKVAQTHALSQEEVIALKSGKKLDDTNKDEDSKPSEPTTVSNVVEVTQTQVSDKQTYTPSTSIPSTDSVVITSRPAYMDSPQVIYRDRIVEKPVEKVVEKIVEKEAPWGEWLKKRTRVQIGLKDTTFSISAIDVIRSIHAVTLILPTANDAMTFTPNTGSRVTIQTKDIGVLDTIFTGANFEIEEVGIFCLSFLITNKPNKETKDAQIIQDSKDAKDNDVNPFWHTMELKGV